MPFRQASPEAGGFSPQLCAAALVGTHSLPYARRGIYFFPPVFELAVPLDSSGGHLLKRVIFRSFRPLSHARSARIVVRETHTDAQTRQAFFSFRIGVLIFCSRMAVWKFQIVITDTCKRRNGEQRSGPVCRTLLPVDPKPGRVLRRATGLRPALLEILHDCASTAAYSCQTWRGENRELQFLSRVGVVVKDFSVVELRL